VFPEISSFDDKSLNPANSSWYALHTRARSEKAVAHQLQERGVTTFLPLVTEVRRWTDRKKIVQLPLFSCYLFVKFAENDSCTRIQLFRCNGVFGLVSMDNRPVPVPDEQISALKKIVVAKLPISEYPLPRIGEKVRIRGGSLDGVQGVLVSRSGNRKLVISINAINRALCISVENYDVVSCEEDRTKRRSARIRPFHVIHAGRR
jgi:transcription antitermination factor NusG